MLSQAVLSLLVSLAAGQQVGTNTAEGNVPENGYRFVSSADCKSSPGFDLAVLHHVWWLYYQRWIRCH